MLKKKKTIALSEDPSETLTNPDLELALDTPAGVSSTKNYSILKRKDRSGKWRPQTVENMYDSPIGN